MRLITGLFFFAVTALSASPANFVTLKNTSSSAVTQPFTISRVFAQGEFPSGKYPQPNTTAGGNITPYQVDVKTHWADGSICHALISFSAMVPANGSLQINFVQSTSSASSGSALTQAQMLAFNSSGWSAEIDATNGNTATANARTMLAAGAWSYWLQGPVVTQVIVEDPAFFTYDFGWQNQSGSWVAAPSAAYKSLHPMFILTFYAGWSGVKEDFILECPWTGSQQDQPYSLSLKNTSSLTQVYSYPSSGLYTHIAASRWRKTFWDGSAPSASVTVDLNLPYITYSKVLPNWDLTVTTPSTRLTTDWASFTASDEGAAPGSTAMVDTRMGDPGGRDEIGTYNAWSVRWIFSGNGNEYQVMMGNANVSASIPSHVKESATGRYFDSGHTINAQGRVLSLDARPTVWQDSRAASMYPADYYAPVGTVTMGSANWGMELSHWPELLFIPYLITGDPFLLQELSYTGSFLLTMPWPYNRGNAWGFPGDEMTEVRQGAWMYRTLAEAWFFTPDSTPEKAYFRQKIDYAMAVEEGFLNVTAGNFPPANSTCPGYDPSAPSSPWCWGNKLFLNGLSNPLHQFGSGATGAGAQMDWFVQTPDPYTPLANGSPFMNLYYLNALGRMAELGLSESAGMAAPHFNWLIHNLQDATYNPYLVGAYVNPIQRVSTNTYYQTWAEELLAFSTTYSPGGTGDQCTATYNLRTHQGWMPCGGIDNSNDVAPGYPWIAVGAASYLPLYGNQDGLDVTAAYGWIANAAQNAPPANGTANIGNNPQYQILPRTGNTASISPTSLPSGTVGTAYSQTLTASNFSGTVTWSLGSGSLPGGLSGCTSGTGTTCTISGTPTTTTGSPFSFTIHATDGTDSVDDPLSITVNPAVVSASPSSVVGGRMVGSGAH